MQRTFETQSQSKNNLVTPFDKKNVQEQSKNDAAIYANLVNFEVYLKVSVS